MNVHNTTPCSDTDVVAGRRPEPAAARIDWLGNITFTAGGSMPLIAITYGIQAYGGHPTG